MIGDKSKPMNSFGRWVEAFYDGACSTTKKGGKRIPSQHPLKRYDRRWRRREAKKEIERIIKSYE